MTAERPLDAASKTSAEITSTSTGGYLAWLIILTVIAACVLTAAGFHFRRRLNERQRPDDVTDCDIEFNVSDCELENEKQSDAVTDLKETVE
jgi:hypothetical protein